MPHVNSFEANDLVTLFAEVFAEGFRTRLVAGGDEPLYRPAQADGDWHEIIFRHDYFQSALHEIAHWCVAGAERRQQVDYGYWYSPDGRSGAQQAEFERVEARPQAVEWLLTAACGKAFAVSVDNLGSDDPIDESSLWRAVHRELMACLDVRLPPRAELFARRLAEHYGQRWPLVADQLVAAAGSACGIDGFAGAASFGGAKSIV